MNDPRDPGEEGPVGPWAGSIGTGEPIRWEPPASPWEAPGLQDPFGEGPPSPYPASGGARPKGRLAVAVAAVLAVVAGGFAIQSLGASDGASSPEGAVHALFAAIDDGDVIGVLESLHPGERDVLVPAAERFGTEIKRLGIASDDLDLRSVGGIDLSVSDLEVRSTPLGDGVALVSVVGGIISVDGDLSDLPMGSLVRDLMDRADDVPEATWSDEAELEGMELVARQSGGRWHVSLLYTLAELARSEMDPMPSAPAYGQGIVPRGAATPEEAVRETLDAALAVDVERLIELMPPGEGDVLHDYGPIILDAIDETEPVDAVVVEELDLSVAKRSGDQALVVVDRFQAAFEDEDGSISIGYDGECVTLESTWTVRFERIGSAIGDEGGVGGPVDETTETSEWSSCGDDQAFLGSWSAPGNGSAATFGFVTVEVGGQWYLSPTRTLFDAVLTAMEAVDPDDLARMVRWVSGEYWLAEPSELWEACGIPEPGLDTDPIEAERAWEDCYESLPDDYEGPYSLFGSLFGEVAVDEQFTAIGWEIDDSDRYDGEYPSDTYEHSDWVDIEESDGVAGATPWDTRAHCFEDYDASIESYYTALECLEDLHRDGGLTGEEVQEFACLEPLAWIDENDEDAYDTAEELYLEFLEAIGRDG